VPALSAGRLRTGLLCAQRPAIPGRGAAGAADVAGVPRGRQCSGCRQRQRTNGLRCPGGESSGTSELLCRHGDYAVVSAPTPR
jgi:hypothetical protein